jgi:effector-binding domain-containing protein
MTIQETASGLDLLVKDVAPFTSLSFTTQTTLQQLNQYNYIPEKLCNEASRLGLIPAGPIQYIYTDVNGDPTNVFQLTIALPVEQVKGEPDGFSFTTFREFHCLSYNHVGSWSEFPELYDNLFAKFHQDGYQGGSLVREVYTIVDFENPENCVTEIQIGLA